MNCLSVMYASFGYHHWNHSEVSEPIRLYLESDSVPAGANKPMDNYENSGQGLYYGTVPNSTREWLKAISIH